MASATKYPDTAFDLMKYLCGSEGAVAQSRMGLAIPPLQSVANSPDFLSPPGIPPMHAKDFPRRESATRRIQQLPREPEWTRIVGDMITRSIQLGDVTPHSECSRDSRRVAERIGLSSSPSAVAADELDFRRQRGDGDIW